MKIAVTYDNGQIFQHFGHTEAFKIYVTEGDQIVSEEVIGNEGHGHGALASYLFNNGVDVLICGGIGGGAKVALAQAGVTLYGGVSGSADEAVRAFISGNLNYNPDVACSHHAHEEGQACGSHGCAH